MPFVFDKPPTTLDALHDLIIEHCEEGGDVITLINRIHASNSVRLDKRNVTPMQNFFDVLLRRFSKVGDALFENGNGGAMDRKNQLDETAKTIFNVSQDHAETTSAIFARRLGIMQRALSKRSREAEMFVNVDGTINVSNGGVEDEDSVEDFSVFPSFGNIMLFQLIGKVFPVTDFKHAIITPSLVLMGQCLGQGVVRTCGERTKRASRGNENEERSDEYYCSSLRSSCAPRIIAHRSAPRVLLLCYAAPHRSAPRVLLVASLLLHSSLRSSLFSQRAVFALAN